MPWPGDHGDEPDDDLPSAPLPPDDRLWRHPSELTWSAGGRPPAPPASPPTRLWAVALTSGLTGAVLALGVVILVSGLGGGVREVIERVPDVQPTADVTTRASGATMVAERMSPSIVRLEVLSEAGSTNGSGIVMRSDGIVLTNAHVLEGAESVTVVLPDGTGYAADIVGVDEVTDVAVLRVDDAGGTTWVPAVLGSAADLEVGEPAIAIGSPLGLAGGPSVTVGVVSGLGRRVTSVNGRVLHDMIQTDARIARGSSGGALCDEHGAVVGITTALAAGDGGDLGFATPIDAARDVADELLDTGEAHHPWLGIEGADLSSTDSSMPGVAGRGGVEVLGVAAGGPADDAGVQPGDVVVALGGERLGSMSALQVALRDHEPGDEVVLTVHRDGEAHDLTVVLAERDEG